MLCFVILGEGEKMAEIGVTQFFEGPSTFHIFLNEYAGNMEPKKYIGCDARR